MARDRESQGDVELALMTSRLWNNPPHTPDGLLDYARLTTAEITEDLHEGLFDRVVNGGQSELERYLIRLDEFCPDDVEEIPAEPPPTPTLIRIMGELLRLMESDSEWSSEQARGLIVAAIDEIKTLIGKRDSLGGSHGE
jgi:hypothetical protein